MRPASNRANTFQCDHFKVRLSHTGRNHGDDIEDVLKAFNTTVWELLIDHMGVKL